MTIALFNTTISNDAPQPTRNMREYIFPAKLRRTGALQKKRKRVETCRIKGVAWEWHKVLDNETVNAQKQRDTADLQRRWRGKRGDR